MKLVWIDDDAHDESLERVWQALLRVAEAEGLGEDGDANGAVRCIDAEHFLLETQKAKYDLAVIDYKVPPTTGEHIASRLLAQSGSIRIIFLSAWLAQFDPRRNVDPRAVFESVEKPTIAESDESWFARLEAAVRRLWAKPFAEYAGFVPNPEMDALSAEVADRRALDVLPFSEQMSKVHALTEAVEASYDDVFETTSAAWLVVTWPTVAIARWGGLDDQLPSAEERQDIEDSYDELSLVVGRPLEVGEIGGTWSSCRQGIDGDPDMYPSLRVELPGWSGLVNVDTGSVATFFSYEDLAGATGVNWLPVESRYNWSRERIVVGPARRGFTASSSVVERQAEVDSNDGTVSISLRLRILNPFYSTGLPKSCGAGLCEGSTRRGDAKYWCGHRRALIGRDVLRLNQLRLVFDSFVRRCYVEVDPISDGIAVSEDSRGASSFLMLGSDLD